MSAPINVRSRFHNSIDACRNVLRREGITGMDSMKHLTLYILARALEVKECKRLGISEQYAWERFKELMALDSKRQECYDLLYNNNGTDLISYLDRLFGTRNFNFKLKNPDNHIAILKILDDVNLKELEGTIDILGTVYENHLGSGSNKSAMRDLGQFFTDRRVCSYMVKLCKPRALSDGKAESVLDPTMGTGGFLDSFVRFLGDSGAKVDWSKMQMDIAGYDIDEFVMSIGRINLYLSTGIIFERIGHRDTLHNDVGEPHQRLHFKIILANMPFGVKGLKYADCCKRVKELKCDGTKSEPLFLNLMMASLDDGGRCAVVVPEGVLVNNSKQHNSTRKYLLDNFDLKRVIRMKGQFFSNTGIQPSILFFEKNGSQTDSIEFWEVEEDTLGSVKDTLIASIPRTSLDEACSLDVRKYQETAAVGNQGAFPTVKLGDLVEAMSGQSLTPEEQDKNPGPYPVVSGGREPSKTYYKANRDANTISVSKFGSYAGFVRWNSTPYWALGAFTLKNKSPERILDKYLYYYLSINNNLLYNFQRKGPTTNFYWSDVVDLLIPLPPLSVQDEIVSALNNLYTTSAGSKSAAECVKAQMIAVVKSLNQRGYEQKKLGDIATGDNGKGLSMQETKANPGTYPILSGGQNYCGTFGKFNRNENTISISKSGSSSGYVKWNTTKFWASDCFTISSKNQEVLLDHFLFYLLSLQQETIYQTYQIKGTIPHCYWKDLESMMIPIPPLSVQQKVLVMLNEMESERKTLEQIATKAEERAKFILDGYIVGSSSAEDDLTYNENGEIVFDEEER